MLKEIGESSHPEKKKKPSPIERERLIVLALGDPGKVAEGGERQKKSHRQIAEEVFDYELSELPPEKREDRLDYRTRTVRETGRNFIHLVNTYIALRPAQRRRIEDLNYEVKLQNPDKNLDNPDSLFDLFEIHRPKNQERGVYGTHHIPTLEELDAMKQPESDQTIEWNFEKFMANLQQANEESLERKNREKESSSNKK